MDSLDHVINIALIYMSKDEDLERSLGKVASSLSQELKNKVANSDGILRESQSISFNRLEELIQQELDSNGGKLIKSSRAEELTI